MPTGSDPSSQRTSTAAMVAALSASLPAKTMLRAFSASSACWMNRRAVSYCERPSVLSEAELTRERSRVARPSRSRIAAAVCDSDPGVGVSVSDGRRTGARRIRQAPAGSPTAQVSAPVAAGGTAAAPAARAQRLASAESVPAPAYRPRRHAAAAAADRAAAVGASVRTCAFAAQAPSDAVSSSTIATTRASCIILRLAGRR